MRKLGWIALVALACACGDDDNKMRSDAGARPDGGRPSDGAGCGIEIGDYQGYGGERVWTEADLAACDALCPGFQDVDCIETNCPGAAEFFTCLDEELFACQTSPGHDCRLEYEDLGCCAYEGCESQQTESGYRNCVAQTCSVENATVEECYVSGTMSESFVACREAAYDSCLVPIECTPSDASPVGHYAGPTTWTRPWSAAEFDSCVTTCSGALSPTACRNSTCPGATDYRACLSVEAASCATQTGAQCRPQWEQVFCCARTNCAGASSNAQLAACLEALCPQEYATFNDCNDTALEGTCKAPAETACDEDRDPDAGTPSDSGVPDDAGESDDAGPQAPSALIRILPTSNESVARGVRAGALPWTKVAPRLADPARVPFTR